MRVVTVIRARVEGEEGIGVVEVLTAAVIVVVGLVGTMTAFDAANRGSFGAQRHEQAITLAQSEIELLEARPFDRLELDSLPPTLTPPDPEPNNPDDPRAYVEGSDFMILANYHDASAGPPAGNADREPLVVDSDAGDDVVSVPPMTTDVPVGPPSSGGAQQTATVYRFVTTRAEPCLSTGECASQNRSKRITVAVSLDDDGEVPGPEKPIYVSSVVTAKETP